MAYAVQIFLFLIILLPKLTLISVPGSGVGIRWDDFAVALLGLVTIFYLVRNPKRLSVLKDPVSLCFLALLAWSLISTIAGVYSGRIENAKVGLMYWGRSLEFFVTYLMARSVSWNGRSLRALGWTVAFSILVVMAYAWGQVAGIAPYFTTLTSLEPTDAVTYRNIHVVMSTFGGHYDFGIFLVMVLSVVLSFGIHYFRSSSFAGKSRRVKIACLAGFTAVCLSAVILLILTRSRSAYIGLLAVIFVLGLLYQPTLIAVSAVLSSVLGFLFFKGKLSLSTHAVSFGGWQYSMDLSTYQRLNKWMAVFRDISFTTLFTGHGLSSLGPAVDGYYVRSLGEIGVIGLILFVLLLTAVFRRLWSVRRAGQSFRTAAAEGVIFALVAISVQAVFIDTFVSSKVMYVFWIAVGIASSLTPAKDQKNTQEKVYQSADAMV